VHADQMHNPDITPRPLNCSDFFRRAVAYPPPNLPPYYPRNLAPHFHPPHLNLFPPIHPNQAPATSPLPTMDWSTTPQMPWVPPSYAQVAAALMLTHGFPPMHGPGLHPWYPTQQMGPFKYTP
jgi:hypothetical protein